MGERDPSGTPAGQEPDPEPGAAHEDLTDDPPPTGERWESL